MEDKDGTNIVIKKWQRINQAFPSDMKAITSFVCTICGKGFTTSECLARHERIRHVDAARKPFVCSCGSEFTKSSEFTLHQRVHFKKCKTLLCATCGKGFSCSSKLTIHERIHIAGPKPFVCTTGKWTSDSSKMTVRERVHIQAGPKPFVCATCGMSFTQENSLTIHENNHIQFKKVGDKSFICAICGMGFTQAHSLTIHEHIHSGFKSFVNANFTGRGSTDSFNSIKTDEKSHKSFVCAVCGKRFSRSGPLTIHERIHTAFSNS